MTPSRPNPNFWRNRRVLVTGHTGFKGSWLCLWLQRMGAEVHGIALPPPTIPDLFTLAGVGTGMNSRTCDIRDADRLSAAIREIRPDIVLHLAAQPLVRHSYLDPVETFATNVMGTVHLLDAVRRTGSAMATVIVTSDKCYENPEAARSFREEDPMGGHDPYSASKGCAELVTASYARSFFAVGNADMGSVCSARAGNVIGGGDWAKDRLVPDLVRGFAGGSPPLIRKPSAVRPWQHVLEPLCGYLLLAEAAANGQLPTWSGGWNFGPEEEDVRSVGEICDTAATLWGQGAIITVEPSSDAPHEADLLTLDSTKARRLLNWHPRWRVNEALSQTVSWYRAQAAGSDPRALTLDQIADYARADTHDLKEGAPIHA